MMNGRMISVTVLLRHSNWYLCNSNWYPVIENTENQGGNNKSNLIEWQNKAKLHLGDSVMIFLLYLIRQKMENSVIIRIG